MFFYDFAAFFDNGSDMAKMIIIGVSRVGECVHHRNWVPLIMSCSGITTFYESTKIFRIIKIKNRTSEVFFKRFALLTVMSDRVLTVFKIINYPGVFNYAPGLILIIGDVADLF